MDSFVGPVLATKTDEDSIISLEKLAWHWAEEATIEYYRWLVYENPSGQSSTFVVKNDSGVVVSMHIVVPLPALIKGKKTLAGISVNVVTHPDYRRKGLSREIADIAYSHAQRSGIEFVFSLPNSMSLSLFTRDNDFMDLGQLSLLVRWIDPGIFLRQNGYSRIGGLLTSFMKLISLKSPRTQTLANRIQAVEDFEKLELKGLSEPRAFCIAPDGDWIRWRYGKHPFRKYECCIIGEPSSPQAVVVYHIMRESQRALIMEFLVTLEAKLEDIRGLFDHITKKCQLAGCSSICALGIPKNRKFHLLKKSGFWNFPLKSVWRPQLVAKSFQSLPANFSISSMDISYGALINIE
jgi:hypothetical protein